MSFRFINTGVLQKIDKFSWYVTEIYSQCNCGKKNAIPYDNLTAIKSLQFLDFW